MPSKKKKFIDKKNAVTFTVVHRSQKDPKTVDEDAPQRVLLSSRQEEQLKYGIEFEDDYDYLQHLKDVKELSNVESETFRIGKSSSEILHQPGADKPRLLLPSIVFASDVETSIGLLNKNIPLIGPQPDLDPDILAALDGQVQSDEELDDNFVSFANAENDEEMLLNEVSDISSDIGIGDKSDDDDKQSRFTGYSMTSSVIRRNTNLQLIDAKFEKFYEKFKNDEDDDSDLGNVDEDDECNDVSQNDDILHQLIEQYQQKANSKAIEMQEFVEKANSLNVRSNKVNDEVSNSVSDSSEEEMEKIQIQIPSHSWDCESIISTYSTTKNQPRTVYLPSKKPIKAISRHQIPNDVIRTSKKEEIDEIENQTNINHQIIRKKDETKEEKMARKQFVKDFRRERRQQKSQTKEFFKEEQLKMNRQLIVNKVNCIGAIHLN